MKLESQEFTGIYRRLIDLRTWDDTTVVGWLEDDYHHFGITLVHDEAVVTAVRIAEPRYPWTACPSALTPLLNLKGVPLFGRCADIGSHIDMRLQCTHLGDLAGLLIAHAFHRRHHRRYHAQVYRLDTVEPGAPSNWLRASLARDGDAKVMEWDIGDAKIMRPAPAAGRSLDRGFREWTDTMDEAAAEATWILRRAAFVSLGRMVIMDQPYIAQDMPVGTVCHNYQPEQRQNSVYRLENRRRFNDGPEGMLALVGTMP